MPAKPGCRDCRRRRTATCRRSITTRVYRLKAAHPRLAVVLNGGIGSDRGGAGASRPRRRRHDGPRRLSGAVAADRRRSACCSARRRGFASAKAAAAALMPYIERELAPARGCTRSRGICTACSAPCPARAPSAAQLAAAPTAPDAGAELLAAALALVPARARLDSALRIGAHRAPRARCRKCLSSDLLRGWKPVFG